MFSSFFNRDPKPFNTGYLPEKAGHKVYFQQYGNPHGKPVLFFHGGPGSSGKPKHANIFNLKTHHIILFDQRGCGKSLPLAETKHNTTDYIIQDAKHLLDHLKILSTSIYGGSWGSTLALLFAQRYPKTIERIAIAQTFLARLQDISWIPTEAGKFYPDIMEILHEKIPVGKNLRSHYAEAILSDDSNAQDESARLYGNYEYMVGALNPKFPEEPPTPEHKAAYRIYMHYDQNNYGVGDNRILENMNAVAHIPLLILHNRLDLLCPVEQSWLVHRAHKNSKLVIVPDYGHGSPMLYKITHKEVRAFLR